MATLEKIRKKSVLLLVVIGLALLAFILTDAINNGRTLFGSGNTVAKAGDVKVDITEYQQRLDMLQKANPDADGQALSQAVIDGLINEKLIDEAAGKMGIEVSPELIKFFIMEQPLQPMQNFMNAYGQFVAQMYPDAQVTPQLMYNIIFTPEKYGLTADQVANLQSAWVNMEKETRQAATRELYMTLLGSTFKANDLDRKELFAINNDSYTVDVAKVPYGELDPKKYPVSEAELKAEYDSRKNLFKVLEPSKTLGVVIYQVSPSKADTDAAAKLKASALKAVKEGAPLGKDLTKEGVRYDKMKTTAAAAGQQAAPFLEAGRTDTVAVFDNNGSFNIVKLLAVTSARDSVEVVGITMDNKIADRIQSAVKGGFPVDSLSQRFGVDSVSVSPAQWAQMQNQQMRKGVPATALAALDTASAGALIQLQATPELTSMLYVKDVKARVPVYEYELISYDLYPSSETIDQATEGLMKFAAANNTPAKFAENASKNAGYQYNSLVVSASTPAIVQGQNPFNGQMSYYPRSSKVIEWAMTDAKPGDVSEVFSNEDAQTPILYIAMSEDAYDDFAPMTNSMVKKELEERVRRSKAGDEMVKKYTGKGDINATAEAMKVPVIHDDKLQFAGSPYVQDGKVAARMTATSDKKVHVVKGDDGVYAYTVNGKNPTMTQPDQEKQNQEYLQRMMRSGQALVNMLRGNKTIENNIYKLTGNR